MTEQIGMLDIQVMFVKKDELLARKILKAREWGDDKLPLVLDCLRYNMFTVNQFVMLSGLTKSTLDYYLRPKLKDGKVVTPLSTCYPFKDSDSDGPKFVYRSEKAIELLVRTSKKAC